MFLNYFKNDPHSGKKWLQVALASSMASGDDVTLDIFKSIYPLASSLIFETVWKNATKGEFFSSKNFYLTSIVYTENNYGSKPIFYSSKLSLMYYHHILYPSSNFIIL